MHKNMSKIFCKFACVIFSILIILSFTGCDDSKTTTVTTKIDDLEWRVTAEIQEWKTCNESGLEVPEGATIYKQEEVRSSKIIGYRTKYKTEEYQELVGYYLPTWRPKYETRTRKVAYQEPIKETVYVTEYYYTIDKWVHLKNVQLACGHDQNYSFPDYICAENERVYNIKYQYLVHTELDKDNVHHIVDKNIWEGLYIGQEIFGEKDQYGIFHVDWDNYS